MVSIGCEGRTGMGKWIIYLPQLLPVLTSLLEFGLVRACDADTTGISVVSVGQKSGMVSLKIEEV